MASLNVDVIMLVLAVLLELALLLFLLCIGFFYESKFRQRTRYYAFALPLGAAVLGLAAALLGADPRVAGLFVNLVILVILVFFGIGLYRKMTGVSR